MIFYCQKTHQSNEGNKSSVKKYQHRGLGGDWAAAFFLNSSFGLADILGHTSNRLLPDNCQAINNIFAVLEQFLSISINCHLLTMWSYYNWPLVESLLCSQYVRKKFHHNKKKPSCNKSIIAPGKTSHILVGENN